MTCFGSRKVTDDSFIASLLRLWKPSYAADYIGFALLLAAHVLVGTPYLSRAGAHVHEWPRFNGLSNLFTACFHLTTLRFSIRMQKLSESLSVRSFHGSRAIRFQLTGENSMEHCLFRYPAIVHRRPVGVTPATWSTQGQCHCSRTRNQCFASSVCHGCRKEFRGTAETRFDCALQAQKRDSPACFDNNRSLYRDRSPYST